MRYKQVSGSYLPSSFLYQRYLILHSRSFFIDSFLDLISPSFFALHSWCSQFRLVSAAITERVIMKSPWSSCTSVTFFVHFNMVYFPSPRRIVSLFIGVTTSTQGAGGDWCNVVTELAQDYDNKKIMVAEMVEVMTEHALQGNQCNADWSDA